MERFVQAIGATIAFAVLSGSASAQIVIKAATEGTEGSQVYATLQFIERDIEAALPGEVDFQIFGGGQLGKDIDVLNGLKLGTHQFTMSCSVAQSVEPTLGLFEAPFLFPDRETAKRVALGPIGDELIANITEKGIIGLGLSELGFRQITNNLRPIRVPEDLAGMKIRIPNTPFRKEMFLALGANPTPVAFGETFAALHQGVIDGQENPIASIYGAKFHEVQDYLSLTNHVFTPCAILASPIHFNSWPENVREALRAAAERAGEYSFELGAELDDKYLEEIRKTTEVNEIDTAAFREASQPLIDQVAENVGTDLMDRVLAEVQLAQPQ